MIRWIVRHLVRLRDRVFRLWGFQFTRFDDENIFHIAAHELLTPGFVDPSTHLWIIDVGLDRSSPVQKWRKFVLETQFRSVSYLRLNGPLRLLQSLLVRKTAWNYHWWAFGSVDPSPLAQAVSDRIRQRVSSPMVTKGYVLLVQRPRGNRFLREVGTGEDLGEYLGRILPSQGSEVRTADFSGLSVEQQRALCAGAGVLLAAHGAALTNLIFTPSNCLTVEISFRSHWYCDPVCEGHFRGTLSATEDCGKGSVYHKADFHTLAQVFDRDYLEVPAVRCEGYRDRNPISRESMFVDGPGLVEQLVHRIQEV